MAWGWRVLSPGEPFTEGKPYSDDTRKIMVVLTDGDNLIWGGWDGHNKSDFTSYGYLAEDRLGTHNRYTANDRIDEKTRTVCNNIKAKGIEIYTITFQVNSSSTKQLFEDCASEPQMAFHSSSNGQLSDVFGQIALDISYLRITK